MATLSLTKHNKIDIQKINSALATIPLDFINFKHKQVYFFHNGKVLFLNKKFDELDKVGEYEKEIKPKITTEDLQTLDANTMVFNAKDTKAKITSTPILFNQKNPQSIILMYIDDKLFNEELRDLSDVQHCLDIHVKENTQGTLIEYYMDNDTDVKNHLNINLMANSQLTHFILKREFSKSAQTLEVHQKTNSHYKAVHWGHSFHYQTNVNIYLTEKEAKAQFYSLMFSTFSEEKENLPKNSKNPKNKVDLDIQLNIHHQAPETESFCQGRSLLSSDAKAQMKGRIIVHPHAKRSHAHFENKCLLLNPLAEMITKPEFEIYHDEVTCTHGATLGVLDSEALFYLKSRGLDETQAKDLLIQAFIQPILEQVKELNDSMSISLMQPIGDFS